MANVSRIRGFKPVRYKNGSPYTGAVGKYYIDSGDSTAVFVGDLVKLAGSADADGTCPTVIKATAGDASIGAVVAFAPNPDNLNISGSYRAASTGRYCYVANSPDLVFEVEASNGTPTVADIGLNCNFAVGSGSTTTGLSGAYADFGTEATTLALPLKIIRVFPRVDNEVGASVKLEVTINEHQYANGVGMDGV